MLRAITGSTTDFSDRVIESDLFSAFHSSVDFRVCIYDGAGLPVSLSGSGSIKPEVEIIEGQWMQAGAGNGEIKSQDLGESPSYDIPIFGGSQIKGRVTLSGFSSVPASYTLKWVFILN